MGRFLKKKTFKKAKNILLDLLIVFIGVFMAFQLSSYRSEDDQKKSRLNFYKAFLAEVNTVNAELIELVKELDTQIGRFEKDSLIASKPELAYNRRLNFVFQKPYIVESAFNSGNFRNLQYDLLASISGGSNLFKVLSDKIKDYNGRVKDLTYNMPFAKQDFYNGNKLRDEYAWYVEDMKEIRYYAVALQSSIEKGAIPAMKTLINKK